MRVIIGRQEALGAGGGNLRLRNAIDIRPAVVEGLYLFRVDIEPGDGEAGFIEKQGQRQSHIAQSNDSNFSGACLDAGQHLIESLRARLCLG
jgi:hypothetical protein